MPVVVAASDGAAVVALALLVFVPLGLLSIFKPRESWRTFESWKYKNPGANEPSDTEYGLRQIGGVVTVVVAVIVVIAVAANGDDESDSGRGIDLRASQQQRRDSTVPEEQFFPPWRTTTTTERQARATETPTTGPATSTPVASTTVETNPAKSGTTESPTTLASDTAAKTVTGSLTVSNPGSTDQTLDRYLVVTDSEGRVITRVPISVDVPARSSVDLDPTPFVDLDLMELGTYYWSISESAAGSIPINSGIFAVSAAQS